MRVGCHDDPLHEIENGLVLAPGVDLLREAVVVADAGEMAVQVVRAIAAKPRLRHSRDRCRSVRDHSAAVQTRLAVVGRPPSCQAVVGVGCNGSSVKLSLRCAAIDDVEFRVRCVAA